LASQNLEFLGKQPQEICDLTPAAMKAICQKPVDELRQIGVFMSMGIMFAGISVGVTTFGPERVVFWRETASGRPVLPYFFGKVLADIPRLIIAAFMFTLSLILFWPYRSHFLVLYVISILLYFSAFAMGYFLSAIIPSESVGLVGTGFALMWGLVLSGVIPCLEKVKTTGNYEGISWLWDISPPRYAIEALYVKEVQARPFLESSTDLQAYTYRISNFERNLAYLLAIGCGWTFIALLMLKLVYRSRMK
jgi:hypothetical protein